MTNELQTRALQAASKYMERRGYEIVETAWSCEVGTIDVIAKDDDTLVFTCVKCHDAAENGLPKDEVTEARRDALERLAAKFLADYDACDMRIRFDLVSMLVIGTDRALIRHHINAFGVDV